MEPQRHKDTKLRKYEINATRDSYQDGIIEPMSNSLVDLGLLLARILHLRRVSAFGKDADGIQFLPQA